MLVKAIAAAMSCIFVLVRAGCDGGRVLVVVRNRGLKNFYSEAGRGLSWHVRICREHTAASMTLGLVHGALNPLERFLSLGMAVLVRVKLLRQFTVELGELSRLHGLHARYQHVDWGVQELVDNVHLVAVLRGFSFKRLQVCFRLVYCSLVNLLLNVGHAFSFVGLRHRLGAKLRIASVSSLSLLERIVSHLTFHFLSCFAEHFLLLLRYVLALLFLLLLQFLLECLSLILLALGATQSGTHFLEIQDRYTVISSRASKG